MSIELQAYSPPTDPTELILDYPSAQPVVDYMTDGEKLVILPETAEDFYASADKMLTEKGLPGMDGRVPVVSYGANANPVRYSGKMAKYASSATNDLLQVTPFQRVSIQGASVVWHGKQGQSGNIFAELYNGPLVDSDIESPSCVAWMTKEQLAVMHTTEGSTYHLTEVPVLAGTDRKPLLAYAYTAEQSTVLLQDGKPIEVRRPGVSKENTMSAREAIEHMLGSIASRDGQVVQATTPEALIAELTSKPNLSAKQAAQAATEAELQAAGISTKFTYKTDEGRRIGRADLGFMSGYHELHLLEEHVSTIRSHKPPVDTLAIEGIRPGEDFEITLQSAIKQHEKGDVAAAVRRRAHNELQERLENQA